MNFFQLKLFYDLLREKSFVKTARLNNCTQPAVSMQIKMLEEKIGVKLFDRAKKSVEPTESARQIEPIVQNIIDSFEKLKIIAKSWYGKPIGDLRIATVHSTGIYDLSGYLKKFLKAYPLINLHLEYRASDTIYDLVNQNKVDLGIVAYPREFQNIQFTPLGTDNMVAIFPKNHPKINGKTSIKVSDLKGEKLVAYSPSTRTYNAVEQFLAKHDTFLNVCMTNNNIDTLKNAVEIGLGISIVPEKTVVNEVRRGLITALPFADDTFIRPIGILYNKLRTMPYVAECFLQVVGCGSSLKNINTASKDGKSNLASNSK